jgi:hypothetical protein
MGFKTFVVDEILTASDVNEYLMKQACMSFTDANARDAALSAVLQKGMVAYVENANELTVYGDMDGSSGNGWHRMGTKAEVDAASADAAMILLYMEVL